jgi:hypothetical protein
VLARADFPSRQSRQIERRLKEPPSPPSAYWQGYWLPSSSLTKVPGWQTKPLRVA